MELSESILTNPYSIDRMNKAVDRSLAMTPEEQGQVMLKMYQMVTTYDVKYWAERLFEQFQDMTHETAARREAVGVS